MTNRFVSLFLTVQWNNFFCVVHLPLFDAPRQPPFYLIRRIKFWCLFTKSIQNPPICELLIPRPGISDISSIIQNLPIHQLFIYDR